MWNFALQCNYMVSSYMALWLMVPCKQIKTHKFHLWGFRHSIKTTGFLKPPQCVQYCSEEVACPVLALCSWCLPCKQLLPAAPPDLPGLFLRCSVSVTASPSDPKFSSASPSLTHLCYRIGSQNHLDWKRPLRSSCPEFCVCVCSLLPWKTTSY